MNRMVKKLLLSLAITVCFLGNMYSEDWVPNTFDNKKFEKANNTVKEYVAKNGTYLSGTNDFCFYYLSDVNISQDSIKPEKNHKFVFVILYKEKVYYYKSFNNYSSGIMDYSIISCEPPIIYLKFNSGIGLDTVIISFDGSDFVMNSIDCVWQSFSDAEKYNALMSIPTKYYYLQGRKILRRNMHDQTYVYSDDEDKIFDQNSHHRIWLLGIDGATSMSEVYYQTYITDDNLRLRTSNSKDANVITLLKKGTEARVLSIDPAITQMEGKDGFWVLIETKRGYIGWIWSNYLNQFSYEWTRHLKDFDPPKNW